MLDGQWRKADASSAHNGCVEVAAGPRILVRDSKDKTGPRLTFTRDAWRLFLADAKAGKFDPPPGDDQGMN